MFVFDFFFLYFLKGGVVLISEDTAEKLLPRFSKRAEEHEQQIQAVANGTIAQLHELVKLVASNEVNYFFLRNLPLFNT